jgi:F-type H+-transporting ATPase subunit b
MRAEALEQAYGRELKVRTEEARNLRLSEVLAGQAEASSILKQAQDVAKVHVDAIRSKLDATVEGERARLPSLVDNVAESILKQIGATAFVFAFAAMTISQVAQGAGGGDVDPWSGIFWPYFQFACFLAALFFFGRKIVSGVLEGRRDTLRTQLSEAKAAVTLAERKAREFEDRMGNLQTEIEALRSQYIEDGVRERNKIVADAQRLAANMVRDAERAANELVTKAREDLRKDLVTLAIAAVESRLVGDKSKLLDARLKQEALQGVTSLSH